MDKPVTIYDIARQLRISPDMVNQALNNHPTINSATKNLIINKAWEMGYRPTLFTDTGRQRTNTLGVIVPRLTSHFMACALAGMEKAANEAGYNLLISQSLESEAKEKANARALFNSRVDGLLVSVAYDTDDSDHFDLFISNGIPLLFFDRVIDHPCCPALVIDNVKAGYEATAHLLSQGCRRIMHVTGNLKRNVYADRLMGYQQALREQGLSFDERLLVVTDLSLEAGVEAAHQLQQLRTRPDGLFVTSDFCAVSCLRALKQAGLAVPHDIAIVGFNNDPVAQVVEPNLTTIHYPGREMGELAVKSLINTLNGLTDMPALHATLLRSELIVRESSQRLSH